MRSFVACAALGALIIGGCPQGGAVSGPDYSGVYGGHVVQTWTLTPSDLGPQTISKFCSFEAGRDGIPVDTEKNAWGPGTAVVFTIGTAELVYTVGEIHQDDRNVTISYLITGTIDGVYPVTGQGSLMLRYSEGGAVEYIDHLAFSDGVSILAYDIHGTLIR